MFTDIVGYTALMGKDSAKALDLVRISKEIQKPLVEKHNGLWLKEMGDGAMAQFGSALDAVNCAVEIQKSARAELDAKLRIGIHSGDITIENNDVYGDGVNIAARLESITDPGGIYISESIEKAIRGQFKVQAIYLGEINLKNVDYGVRTYAIQGVGLPVPDLKKDKELSGRIVAEIKRRGVIRAGIMYILISLLLVLLQPFVSTWITLPDTFSTILLIVLGIGFPISVYMAWRYELSPEGFVRSNSEQSWQNPLDASQRKPLTGNLVTWGLAMAIFTLMVYDNIKLQEEIPADMNISLAILPFRNNSGNDALDHYGMGMASEVRSKLSYSKKFDFISAMQATIAYANTTASPMEIGQDLKVDYLLTGMFQVAGEKIKVDVEMVDAQTGNGIWSESYNELFTDIFDVQSKIAGEVMEGFSFDQQLENEVPTENLEAYGQYLLGIAIVDKSHLTPRTLPVNHFKSAIQLDSGFIDAWVALLDLETHELFRRDSEFDKDSLLIEVDAHMVQFNTRFPYSWKNTLVKGFYAYHGIKDYEKGLELFKEVLNHDPENFDANHLVGAIYKRKLHHEEAIQYHLKAVHQNPNSPIIWNAISVIFKSMGDYESATIAARKAKDLGGGNTWLFSLNFFQGIVSSPELIDDDSWQLLNKHIQRDFSGLISMIDEMETPKYSEYNHKATSYFLLEELDSARHYAMMLTQQFKKVPYDIIAPPIERMYAILGNKQKAMELVQAEIDKNIRIGDHLMLCNNYLLQIMLLSLLGDYQEATEKLLELNLNYPQYGDYARIYNWPDFDKIKEEYPPFLEALNNIKLPMKLMLDELELL